MMWGAGAALESWGVLRDPGVLFDVLSGLWLWDLILGLVLLWFMCIRLLK